MVCRRAVWADQLSLSGLRRNAVGVGSSNLEMHRVLLLLHRSTIIGHPVRHFHAALCIDVSCSSRTWAGVLFPWRSISQ
jgi:hypothetical protein